jgi:hypothetical protein
MGSTAGAKAPAGNESRSGNGVVPGADCESRVVVVRGDALRVEPIRWLWDGWRSGQVAHVGWITGRR